MYSLIKPSYVNNDAKPEMVERIVNTIFTGLFTEQRCLLLAWGDIRSDRASLCRVVALPGRTTLPAWARYCVKLPTRTVSRSEYLAWRMVGEIMGILYDPEMDKDYEDGGPSWLGHTSAPVMDSMPDTQG